MSSLEEAFGKADAEHHTWTTRGAYVSARERALIEAAFMPLGDRVIDLGCGEGATLYHLGAPEGAVGVDLFEAKTVFARERMPQCEWVTASALSLPFDDARFDHVLVRDLIHHVDEPAALIDEASRVLVPGGRIDVLEPCRYNPMVAAHGLLLPVERGELRSTVPFVRGLLEPCFAIVSVTPHQPMPLHRVLFHPKFGWPSLADSTTACGIVSAIETAARAVVPRAMWSYLHIRATKRAVNL